MGFFADNGKLPRPVYPLGVFCCCSSVLRCASRLPFQCGRWACLAPQPIINRRLDVGDGPAVRRRRCLTLQPGLVLSDVRYSLNRLMDHVDSLTADISMAPHVVHDFTSY
jgi:hypothetical protein